MSRSSEDTRKEERQQQQQQQQQPPQQDGSSYNEKPLMQRPLPAITSKHLAQERTIWRKMILLFVVLLGAIILGILSLYWGADHSLQFNEPVFTVAIIDFDERDVGPALQQAGVEARAAMPEMTLGYVSQPGSMYDYSNEQTRHALKQEHFWMGIVVQANATSAMEYAYSVGNESYDPTGAIQFIYGEGRNALAIDEFAYPAAIAFLDAFVREYAQSKQRSLASTNAGNATALALQAENPIPVAYTIYNTAPYVPSTAEAATEIGTIYLLIVSFLSVLMFGSLNEATMGKVPMGRYYAYRMLVLPVLYFFLSLLYMALSAVWQIRFDKFFGPAGYIIYWMLCWLAMMAFGLALENVNNVLGPPFTPVFFAFWVISNVATGFFPIELLSNFYKWGLAWPLRHVLIGSKALVYGTKNVLGLNFGVLIAWVAVSLALQPLTIWFQLRRKKAVVEAHRREVLERVHGKEDDEEKEL